MTRAIDFLKITQAAIKFAQAARDTEGAKWALQEGYVAWRNSSGYREYVSKGSPEWTAMMAATAGEYRALQRAKARERRAKAALLKTAPWEAKQ